jgi:uncharacterized protein
VIRAVVDPSVLVSGVITSGGPPAHLLDRWLDAEIELIVCPHLLDELEGVLLRTKFRGLLTPDEAVTFVELLRLTASVKPDPQPAPGLTPDPKDDYIVALAREAGADCVVSGDAHLIDLPDPRPPVLRPRALLEILERASPTR